LFKTCSTLWLLARANVMPWIWVDMDFVSMMTSLLLDIVRDLVRVRHVTQVWAIFN
jgi:hypothetical protein